MLDGFIDQRKNIFQLITIMTPGRPFVTNCTRSTEIRTSTGATNLSKLWPLLHIGSKLVICQIEVVIRG